MRQRAASALTVVALLTGGCASTPAAEPAPAPPPDLVADVDDPLVIAHRGGASIYPEHSMEGYEAAADAGFAAEPDLQFLTDGTPVALHDPTVDRTMTGATGPVTDLTLEQWQKTRIRPAPEGGPDAAPVTFEQILDQLGGDTLLVPEVKPDATSDQVDVVVDMVTDRDLDDAVLMQSYTYTAVQQMIDAGLDCLYLTDDQLPPESLEQMRADGVEWIGAARGMDPADVQQLADAGFRVVAYTVQTQADLDDLPEAFSGYFSDDPWTHAGADTIDDAA